MKRATETNSQDMEGLDKTVHELDSRIAMLKQSVGDELNNLREKIKTRPEVPAIDKQTMGRIINAMKSASALEVLSETEEGTCASSPAVDDTVAEKEGSSSVVECGEASPARSVKVRSALLML